MLPWGGVLSFIVYKTRVAMFTACKYCGESKRVEHVTAQHGGRELLFKRAVENRENHAGYRISRMTRMCRFFVPQESIFCYSELCSIAFFASTPGESGGRNSTYPCRFRSRGHLPVAHRIFPYSASDFVLVADSGSGSEHISANTHTPSPPSQSRNDLPTFQISRQPSLPNPKL